MPETPFNYQKWILAVIGIIVFLVIYEVFLKRLTTKILNFIINMFQNASLLTCIFLTVVIFIMSVFPIPGLGVVSTVVSFLI